MEATQRVLGTFSRMLVPSEPWQGLGTILGPNSQDPDQLLQSKLAFTIAAHYLDAVTGQPDASIHDERSGNGPVQTEPNHVPGRNPSVSERHTASWPSHSYARERSANNGA
jgi:hypothetical protein